MHSSLPPSRAFLLPTGGGAKHGVEDEPGRDSTGRYGATGRKQSLNLGGTPRCTARLCVCVFCRPPVRRLRVVTENPDSYIASNIHSFHISPPPSLPFPLLVPLPSPLLPLSQPRLFPQVCPSPIIRSLLLIRSAHPRRRLPAGGGGKLWTLRPSPPWWGAGTPHHHHQHLLAARFSKHSSAAAEKQRRRRIGGGASTKFFA